MRPARATFVAILVALCATHAASAQRPGEVRVTVTDAATAAAVEGVDVLLPALQHTAITDATGRATLRGIEPGEWTLELRRLGFVTRRVEVTVRNGETARVTLRLAPQPMVMDALTARVDRAPEGTRITRPAVEQSGARTAGDALRDVAGIVVRSSGPGSPQHVSMRGMAPDAVLVLLDGVPLNDPVTGEADLSLVDASTIEAITVLPGARSARWGPRAAAGVIRIETRRGDGGDRRVSVAAGSLGTWDAALAWSGGRGPTWSVGAALRGQDGAFDFELPEEVGGGTRRRANADLRALEIHGAGGVPLAGGELDVRAAWDALERGLPGRGFAPSRHARQDHDRMRAALTWRRTTARSSFAALVAGTHQDLLHADSLPPFGLPWSDTTRATSVEVRIDAERALHDDVVAGTGVELRHQHIGGSVLAADAPPAQLDAGLFAHGTVPLMRIAGLPVRLALQGRLDRNPEDDGVVASHSVTLGWTGDVLDMHVAHRSSYSPPTPGDRFFRDAVGIEPNPDLRAERVPGEIEIGAGVRRTLGAWGGALRASAYRGDIEGMILWSPDYRYVWSPRNQNARRTGLEASADLTSPGRLVRLAGTYTYARATYDRGSDDDDVQIAYRPRHAGVIDGVLHLGATRIGGTLRYTGERTTAPSRLNLLPEFWTFDAAIMHELSIGAWSAAIDVRIDRVFDADGSLIFGYPEPGRTLRIGVRLTPVPPPPPVLSIGDPQ